ncbi:MAG TPA: MFS transporter [Euzebyales bacterium]
MATHSFLPPPTSSVPDDVVRRARLSVAVLFCVNGLIIANVVPWLPAIKSELDLTNTAFGVGWAAGPLGGLALGAAAGALTARFGSGRTATVCAVLGTATMPLVAVAPTWLAFAGSLFAMGAADAVTDAAMNAHALRVQRRYGRSIINSFHALWSAGAVAGGLIGATAVGLDVPRVAHLTGVALLLTVVLLVSARWQLPGHEETERTAQTGASPNPVAGPPPEPEPAADGHGGRGVLQALRTAPWLLLGLAALPTMGGAVEDSAASWAAVHLRETLGAGPFVAGLGFVAAQTLMVVGRVTGDRFVDRFGAARVARTGSLLAAVGMLAAAAGPVPAVVIAGFGLAGLGVATLFPLGFAAAGDIPGVRSADGIAIASWIARLSFLIVPPLIGVVADDAGLRWGLGLVLLCALAAAALSGLLPGRRD